MSQLVTIEISNYAAHNFTHTFTIYDDHDCQDSKEKAKHIVKGSYQTKKVKNSQTIDISIVEMSIRRSDQLEIDELNQECGPNFIEKDKLKHLKKVTV